MNDGLRSDAPCSFTESGNVVRNHKLKGTARVHQCIRPSPVYGYSKHMLDGVQRTQEVSEVLIKLGRQATAEELGEPARVRRGIVVPGHGVGAAPGHVVQRPARTPEWVPAAVSWH